MSPIWGSTRPLPPQTRSRVREKLWMTTSQASPTPTYHSPGGRFSDWDLQLGTRHNPTGRGSTDSATILAFFGLGWHITHESLHKGGQTSVCPSRRRAKKPFDCERCCGVSISDKSAPQKYGKIMHLVLWWAKIRLIGSALGMACRHSSASFAGARARWPRQVVEMRRTAECGRCADQKPSASSP